MLLLKNTYHRSLLFQAKFFKGVEQLIDALVSNRQPIPLPNCLITDDLVDPSEDMVKGTNGSIKFLSAVFQFSFYVTRTIPFLDPAGQCLDGLYALHE